MSRIPDRFDLWVRRARATTTVDRQVDFVLGALVARTEVYFVDIGETGRSLIARAEIASATCALIFTDAERVHDFLSERPDWRHETEQGPPVIASPTAAALEWCIENGLGVVVNLGVGGNGGDTAANAGRLHDGMETAWRPAGGGVLDSQYDNRGRRFLGGKWAVMCGRAREDITLDLV